MITKERLEELIEQEGTVWCVSGLWGSNKLKLHNKDVRDSDCFHISKTLLLSDSIEFYDEEETYRVPFQLLFETEQEYLKHQEEAEWHKEFGCIEKPQYLKFPNWKQIENYIENMRKFGLYHSDRVLARIITSDSIYYFKLCKNLDLFTFELKQTYIGDGLCEQISNKFPKILGKATKENYTLACRKAKELFLGEQNDNQRNH